MRSTCVWRPNIPLTYLTKKMDLCTAHMYVIKTSNDAHWIFSLVNIILWKENSIKKCVWATLHTNRLKLQVFWDYFLSVFSARVTVFSQYIVYMLWQLDTVKDKPQAESVSQNRDPVWFLLPSVPLSTDRPKQASRTCDSPRLTCRDDPNKHPFPS